MGMNHSFLFSPNTSRKLLYFPKLNPFLSGPVWNIGDLKDSETKNQIINCQLIRIVHGSLATLATIEKSRPQSLITLHTVMILSFRTHRPGQTVQTQIRLLLEEQSDQGLHCLPFRLHRLDSLVYGKAT